MREAVVKEGESQPRFGRNRVQLVPGNGMTGTVGHGVAADPPRVRMNELRWCKSQAKGTTGVTAFGVRV